MDIQQLGKSLAAGSPISDKLSASPTTAVTKQPYSSIIPSDAGAAKATRDPSVAEVKQAVSDINKTIQAMSQNLEFSVDTDTDEVIVKVIDQQTRQVLRQIPSVEAIEIAKSLDKLQGLLIHQQA